MIKAYINHDCCANCFNNALPQVEIYDDHNNVEYESYKTIEEMEKRVAYINSLRTDDWKLIGEYKLNDSEVC